MNEKMEIYVVSHNLEDIERIESNDTYIPLFVGRAGEDNFGFCSDDSGDNISKKNSTYCELTGLYWMWKNAKSDILGLVHYRRYFAQGLFKKRLEKDDVLEILKDYDIILPKRQHTFFENMYVDYDHWHYAKDIDVCVEVIHELFPEYIENYNNAIMNSNSLYYFNMFICSKKIVDRYCSWLFPILNEVENRIDIEDYNDYQSRVFGYLSELLFDVWMDKQNFKVKECKIKTLGVRLNIHMFIFKSKFVRGVYKLYLKYINPEAKRRY